MCQLFLENETRKKTTHLSVQLESTKGAWDILGLLTKLKILKRELNEDILVSYCFDRGCGLRYKPQKPGRKFCECGFPLFDKNDIAISAINEEAIARWLLKRAQKADYKTSQIIKRTVLNKKVFIIELIKGSKQISYMPITSEPNSHFLEVIRARYPDVCIITSKDNLSIYTEIGLCAEKLYDFFNKIELENKELFVRNYKKIRQSLMLRQSERAQTAGQNLSSDAYYIQKNTVAKNLGAELFEADCHSLWQDMLGLSIWLGAKQRGQAVPDGRSVFPFFPSIGIDKGCFAWDSKFTTGTRSKIGSTAKNKKYIHQLYVDPSLQSKKNRALIFVSNKKEQLSFRSTALSILQKRRAKIVYVKSEQLVKIYQHFRENKEKIDRDERAKKYFYTFLKDLITSIKRQNGGKALILSDSFLDASIEKNSQDIESIN